MFESLDPQETQYSAEDNDDRLEQAYQDANELATLAAGNHRRADRRPGRCVRRAMAGPGAG